MRGPAECDTSRGHPETLIGGHRAVAISAVCPGTEHLRCVGLDAQEAAEHPVPAP